MNTNTNTALHVLKIYSARGEWLATLDYNTRRPTVTEGRAKTAEYKGATAILESTQDGTWRDRSSADYS